MRNPEVHVFVIWSEARFLEPEILADIDRSFTVLELLEVHWTPGEVFARNLTRMYGDALPPGSDKEVHCGSGPFLAVVVRDDRPRYGVRRTTRGPKRLNSNVFDSRSRYREWTGGGYRVHASDSVAEAERNLVLLLGRHAADFGRDMGSHGSVRSQAGDPIGTYGWDSVEQLVMALEAHDCVLLSRSTGPEGDAIVFRTTDLWWAEHVAVGSAAGDHVLDVPVRGGFARLTLVEVPPPWRFDWVRTVRPWVRRARRLGHALRPTG
jgi:hypothetical protein